MSVKKRGRPRRFGPVISVRLPFEMHEAIELSAGRRRIEFSEEIRRRLRESFRQTKIDSPAAVLDTASTSTHG